MEPSMHPVEALVEAARKYRMVTTEKALADMEHEDVQGEGEEKECKGYMCRRCDCVDARKEMDLAIIAAESWLAREKERCERVEEECYQKGRHDGLAAGRAEGVKALEAVQAEACSGWGFDVVDRVRSLIDAQLAVMGKKE